MLPSLLARDIQQGVTQFLITGFEPADGFFHGVMHRFVDNEAVWMKGPYLQVGLPFRHDSAGTDQARRFARCIANTPAFHGLRVGLFVGGNASAPGAGWQMTAESVITDRDT